MFHNPQRPFTGLVVIQKDKQIKSIVLHLEDDKCVKAEARDKAIQACEWASQNNEEVERASGYWEDTAAADYQ